MSLVRLSPQSSELLASLEQGDLVRFYLQGEREGRFRGRRGGSVLVDVADGPKHGRLNISLDRVLAVNGMRIERATR